MPTFPLGKVTGAAALGGLKMHHGLLFQIALLALQQNQ